MNKVIEFNQLSGTVEYSCVGKTKESGEMSIYIESFCTLNDLLKLITQEKLKELKSTLQATEVSIDAICLNTETPDSKEKVELLLMCDGFYGQSIRKTE